MNPCFKPIFAVAFVALVVICTCTAVRAQDGNEAPKPMTNQEFVGRLNQLRQEPMMLEDLIETVRRRGIGFILTDGIRSLAATRSGNNVALRRTLEEAERRRANPTEHAVPNAVEANDVLAKSKTATLEAANSMPDFLVKQLIARSYSRPGVTNWQVYDHISVAVSFRAEQGEQYRLLSINGSPAPQDSSYSTLGNSTSTGEFVTSLATLFADKSHTVFRAIDTDVLRTRRTIVFEYEVLKRDSNMRISIKLDSSPERITTTGMKGRLWIDRENFRVLRAEFIATEVPPDFPAKGSYRLIDYDWVTISANKFLLPIEADVRLEFRIPDPGYPGQSRNEIKFRNYQKFSTDVRILDGDDEVIDDSAPPVEEPKPANPPETTPTPPKPPGA